MGRKAASTKTKKSVAKRFKITANGKVLHSQAGRRHIASSKNRKRMRHLASRKVMDTSDMDRIKLNLPFHR